MATKTSKNRTTLVDGCGTILKTNRLEHGYKLVKRKKSTVASAPKKVKVMASASAPVKRKAGRPAKAKVMASASAPVKRKAGRPAKAKVITVIKEKVVMTAPVKRKAGRPAKAKVMVSAPSKAKVSAPSKRRGKRQSVKA